MRSVHTMLSRVLAWLAGAALAGMVALTLLQIIRRYFFGASLVWIEEVTVMMLISATWIGIGYLWLQRRHIDIDLFTKNLSPMSRHRFDRVADVLAVIIGVAIAYLGSLTIKANAGLEIAALEIDALWKYVPVAVGGVLLATAGFINLFVKREFSQPVAEQTT
jgi:TRAP-type transport system small permease protein